MLLWNICDECSMRTGHTHSSEVPFGTCMCLSRFYLHVIPMTVVTPTDRPKSVRNRCVIKVLVAFCVVHWFSNCWYRGFFFIGLSHIDCLHSKSFFLSPGSHSLSIFYILNYRFQELGQIVPTSLCLTSQEFNQKKVLEGQGILQYHCSITLSFQTQDQRQKTECPSYFSSVERTVHDNFKNRQGVQC